MKYAWINPHRTEFPTHIQCNLLGVSRSGFHDWIKMSFVDNKSSKDSVLLAAIQEAY